MSIADSQAHVRRRSFLPHDGRNKVHVPENLVHQHAQVLDLMIIDANEDRPVLAQ